jgi:hypothetical protein
MTFLLTPFFFMQKADDYDFFEWADKEMSVYEKRLAQHLKVERDGGEKTG